MRIEHCSPHRGEHVNWSAAAGRRRWLPCPDAARRRRDHARAARGHGDDRQGDQDAPPRARRGVARPRRRSAPPPQRSRRCRAKAPAGSRRAPAPTSARPAPSPKSGRTRRISSPSSTTSRRRRRRSTPPRAGSDVERDQGAATATSARPARPATTNIVRRCTTERASARSSRSGTCRSGCPLAARRPDRVQLVVGPEPPHRLAHLVGLSRS